MFVCLEKKRKIKRKKSRLLGTFYDYTLTIVVLIGDSWSINQKKKSYISILN